MMWLDQFIAPGIYGAGYGKVPMFKKGDAVEIVSSIHASNGRRGVVHSVVIKRTEEERRANRPGLVSFDVSLPDGIERFRVHQLRLVDVLDVLADF
jgi:hypothetical protein